MYEELLNVVFVFNKLQLAFFFFCLLPLAFLFHKKIEYSRKDGEDEGKIYTHKNPPKTS